MGRLRFRLDRLEHEQAAIRGPQFNQILHRWDGGYEAAGIVYQTEAEAWAAFGPAGPCDCRLVLTEQAPSDQEWETRAKGLITSE
jgi:hypothetical protein